MKYFIAVILNILFLIQIKAQQHYVFSQDTMTYTELSGANIITNPDFANDKFTFLPVEGKTYNFFGLDFDFGGVRTMVIQTYGNMRIDNDSSMVIIDGVFGFLDSLDGNTSISWVIEGQPGKEIVKAQWKNVGISSGQPGNFVNFQLWLHQRSGIIELRYGPRSANNASGFTSSTGPYAGLFYADDNVSTMYEKLWLHGHPSDIKVDSAQNFTFKRLLGVPGEGTVYRFTPKAYLDTLSPPLAVKELKQEHVRLYPNPATGTVQMTISSGQAQSVFVHDISGRQVLHLENPAANCIDVSGLAPGFYKITLKMGDTLHTASLFRQAD